MRSAVDAHLIAQSPCQGIRLPRVARQEQRFLSAEQVDRLADAIGPCHRALIYSAAYLGCRWGELAGLKRDQLDLLRRRVYVIGTLEEIGSRVRYVHETKTSESRRVLSVPRFLVDVLAEHLAGAPESDYMFTSRVGDPLRRSSFRQSHWLPAVRRAGLEALRFHDLRHTCVALLIAQGAHPKEIQVRLGHASITTTLNTYGHLMPSLDAALSERLDHAYREGKTGTNGDQMGTKRDEEVVELKGRRDGKGPVTCTLGVGDRT
jgi:integrase